MVLIIATEINQSEAFKIIIKRCGIILLPLSVILIKYYPALGRRYHPFSGELSIMGMATDKNNLGVLCIIIGILVLWNFLYKGKEDKDKSFIRKYMVGIMLLVMTLWLLRNANSATSTICFVAGVIILISMRTSYIKNNYKMLIPLGILTGIILLIWEELLGVSEIVLEGLGRDITLTGRTEFWKELLSMGTNPIIGTGYGGFWLGPRIEELWERHWMKPGEAHNGYLEIYLELGVIGLVLLGGIIITGIRNIYGNIKTDYKSSSLWISLLIITLLHNLSESSFRAGQLIYFIFLLSVIKKPMELKTKD
jgi:O-antigen ligase